MSKMTIEQHVKGVGAIYRELAIQTFQHQWITNIDDDRRVLAICQEEICKAGYPCTDANEDDWLEYVYAATEIWEIARKGHVYRRERNADKPSGWDFVLYTRINHPAFAGE